ncbi:CLUMA_CG007466, isoform A [Clunio marinus]|uniref:CLUMA_CG007466, isoform A n=1 Tax=Clunio marinus TaxID=568069 RepID=A0A1J1I158_9DIPT|nr:CLUMA_CG007466, isoform A [Clunio marinus]
MKSFQLIILYSLIALIASDFGDDLSSSEERELLCSFSVTKHSINPKMEVFLANLSDNEFKELKLTTNRRSFRGICRRIQQKLVGFQTKIYKELIPCLRNETIPEYESYIKITQKVSGFICKLDERRLEILTNIANYEAVLSAGEKLLNCARNSTSNEFNFSSDFCSINEEDLYECSLNILGADNTKPRTLLKMLWKLLSSLINCGNSSTITSTKKINANYVSGYINRLLLPIIQDVFRDNINQIVNIRHE